MDSTAQKYDPLIMVLSGTFGSVLIGFMVAGQSMLNYKNQGFQFILLGFFLSVLIACAKIYPSRIYLYTSLTIMLLIPFATNSLSRGIATTIVRDLIFGGCIALSLFGGKHLRQFITGSFTITLEFVLWVVSIVVAYISSGLFLALIYDRTHIIEHIAYQGRLGLVIGVGVSSGITTFVTLAVMKSPKKTRL